MLSTISRLFYLERIGISSIILIVLSVLAFGITNNQIQKKKKAVVRLYSPPSDNMDNRYFSGDLSRGTIERRRQIQRHYRDSLEKCNTYSEREINAKMMSIEFTHRMLEEEVYAINKKSPLYIFGVSREGPRIWAILGHPFIHSSLFLLLINLYFIYVLTTVLERYWSAYKVISGVLLVSIGTGFSYVYLSKIAFLGDTSSFHGLSAVNAGMVGAFWVLWSKLKSSLPYITRTRVSSLPWFILFYLLVHLLWGVVMSKFSPASFYLVHFIGLGLGALYGVLMPGKSMDEDKENGEELQEAVAFEDDTVQPVGVKDGVMSEAQPVEESQREDSSLSTLPSEKAWELFRAGDFVAASEGLVAAMEIFLCDIVRFEKVITREMLHIYEVHKQLQIPVEAYYHWAMQFEVNKFQKSALFAYELCAQYAKDDITFRLRSLLKSAELRVETESDVARAKQLFEFIIANDKKGALRRQAEYALEQLQG